MKKKKEFSKKILIADYLIALLIVIFLIICSIKNYIYVSNIQRTIIETGCQISIIYPYDLTNLTIILTAWIGQLGISSTAYYIMCSITHYNSWQSIITLLIVGLCCANNRAEKGEL